MKLGCKSKLKGEGGVIIKLASSRVLSWGPRTHHVLHRCPENRPHHFFLPLLKFAAFALKNNTARRKRMWEYFF